MHMRRLALASAILLAVSTAATAQSGPPPRVHNRTLSTVTDGRRQVFQPVRVFVDRAAAPVLEVQRLTTRASGWVGLWVGNTSPGDFANVTITPAGRVAFTRQ
jgi:hypothetical protein